MSADTDGKPPPPTRPVLSTQAVLQNDSRPLVDQALSPWPVTDWVKHDYGIDAVVEIADRRDGVRNGSAPKARKTK